MSALVVGQQTMEWTSATLPNPRIITPLVASEWSLTLQNANLLQRYPHIPTFISLGADARIPTLSSTFTPLNHPSVDVHKEVFLKIVNNEFTKGRYWEPFSEAEIESIIGSFQKSPISLIFKPGKPGKFHLIQNLSYPLITKSVQSINSSIVMNLYLFQEIGLVACMFFFELLFSLCFFTISLYVAFTNLFPIALSLI